MGYDQYRNQSKVFLVIGVIAAMSLSGACTQRKNKLSAAASTLPSQVGGVLGSCTRCHSGPSAPAGFSFVTDVNAMVAAGLIVPGSAEDSVLFNKLGVAPPYGARMPFGGPYLSDTELQTIKDWIDNLGRTAEIAITTPPTGTFIDSTNDSATFSVSGSCNVQNATVTVFVNEVSVGTATCDGANFALTVDTTQTPFTNAAVSGETGANVMIATLVKTDIGISATSGSVSLPKDTNSLSISLTSHLNSSSQDRTIDQSDSSLISSANDSTSHAVAGACTSVGRAVSIKIDGVQVATATCNGSSFSGTFDSTTISDGNHKLTVSMADSGSTSVSASAYIYKWAATPTISFQNDIKPIFVLPSAVGSNLRACIDCHYVKTTGTSSGGFAMGYWASCPGGGKPTGASGACENSSATSAYTTTPSDSERNNFVFRLGYYKYTSTTAGSNEGNYGSKAMSIVNDKSDYTNFVANRIVRGNPAQSFIYARVTAGGTNGTTADGAYSAPVNCFDALGASPASSAAKGCRTSQVANPAQMPAYNATYVPSYLSATQKQKIYTWIIEGARTDN